MHSIAQRPGRAQAHSRQVETSEPFYARGPDFFEPLSPLRARQKKKSGGSSRAQAEGDPRSIQEYDISLYQVYHATPATHTRYIGRCTRAQHATHTQPPPHLHVKPSAAGAPTPTMDDCWHIAQQQRWLSALRATPFGGTIGFNPRTEDEEMIPEGGEGDPHYRNQRRSRDRLKHAFWQC